MRSASFLGNDFATKRKRLGSNKCSPKERRLRLFLIAGPILIWIAAVICRLVSLQVTNFDRWQEWAVKQHQTEIKLASERGPIVDSQGRLLSVSVPAGSTYIRPRQFRSDADRVEAAKKISGIFDMNEKQVLEKLKEKSPFVWLQRQIPRNKAEKIRELKIPGADYLLESKRYYPYGVAASRVIGKVGIDGVGLSGLEREYNELLTGEAISDQINRDGVGKRIDLNSDGDDFSIPRGEPLQLTIDARVQQIIEQELEAGRIEAGAKRGLAVMADADSGEILGLSQVPPADFNNPSDSDPELLRNLVVETVYEPGSTLKPIVAAAALEKGLINLDEMVDCEHGRFQFARRTINDVHPLDRVSFRDVIVQSSNIGMTKVGIRLGADRLYNALTSFGLGSATDVELPGESKGILRDRSTWAQIDIATHSFGQGVAVTPLQMVRAFSALVNGGTLPNLHLIKNDEEAVTPRKRVLSEKTSRLISEVLYAVTEDDHGTGRQAAIEGMRVGGKTGTAQKASKSGRGYQSGKYVASFVGFADGSVTGVKRKISLIVLIDEPTQKSIYGGVLAAPVFRRIMQQTMAYFSTSGALKKGAPELDEENPFRDSMPPKVVKASLSL